jgi:RimJ/RimL family protein N-acetyltransferase
MIDVVTYQKDDRGKGLATAATVALLDYCLERKLVPLWETTEDNVASQRLAEKLGFIKHETYPVYAIEF